MSSLESVLFIVFTFGCVLIGILAMATAPRVQTSEPPPVDIEALEREVLSETGYDMADRIEREFDRDHPEGKHITSWIVDPAGRLLLPVYSDDDPYDMLNKAEAAYLKASKNVDERIREGMRYFA